MAEHGSPYTPLQRAIRSGNLPLMQATASSAGSAARRAGDPAGDRRQGRGALRSAAVRWAGRLALEVRDLTLKEPASALDSLVALPDENAQP